MMIAFGYAVIKSIIHRKEIDNHSWWLISTVFLIMMPALGRGVQFVWIVVNMQQMPNVDIMVPLYIAQMLIIGMIAVAAWKFGTLRHPATYLAVAVNVFVLFLEQKIIEAVIYQRTLQGKFTFRVFFIRQLAKCFVGEVFRHGNQVILQVKYFRKF